MATVVPSSRADFARRIGAPGATERRLRIARLRRPDTPRISDRSWRRQPGLPVRAPRRRERAAASTQNPLAFIQNSSMRRESIVEGGPLSTRKRPARRDLRRAMELSC